MAVVTYGFGELDMLVPAYAATIHKSKARNIHRGHPNHDAALRMLQRNFSTRRDRGKRLVVLSGRRRPSPSGAQRLRPAALVEAGEWLGRVSQRTALIKA